jgi:hypothetical protein
MSTRLFRYVPVFSMSALASWANAVSMEKQFGLPDASGWLYAWSDQERSGASLVFSTTGTLDSTEEFFYTEGDHPENWHFMLLVYGIVNQHDVCDPYRDTLSLDWSDLHYGWDLNVFSDPLPGNNLSFEFGLSPSVLSFSSLSYSTEHDQDYPIRISYTLAVQLAGVFPDASYGRIINEPEPATGLFSAALMAAGALRRVRKR